MKKISIIFTSILLLVFGYSLNSEAFAFTPIQEKENIKVDLENLRDSQEISKKTKKNIEYVIKEIEKSLDGKFWKDETTLNEKIFHHIHVNFIIRIWIFSKF